MNTKLFSHLAVALLIAITLTWQDNSGNLPGCNPATPGTCDAEDGFNVYRQHAGVWSVLGTTGSNIATFVDSTAAAGDCYKVTAFNIAGESAFSGSVCLPLLPPPPTNLQKK